MMSRISSNNLFAHSMLRKMWLYIISLVVLMIAGPGRLLMQIDNLLMWNPSITRRELMANLIYYAQFTNQLNLVIVIAITVAFAFFSFRYLYSRSKVDLYHSMAIKRKDMYRQIVLSAIIPLVIIRTITFLAILGVFAAKGILVGYTFGMVFTTYILGIIFSLIFFSLTVIAISITGNLLAGGLATLALFSLTEMIFNVYDSYKNFCFETVSYITEFSWIRFLLSPLTAMRSFGVMIEDSIPELIVILVIMVLLYFAAGAAFVVRPSEGYNKAVVYKGLNPVIRILATMIFAMTAGMYVVFVQNTLTQTWYWISFIVAGILVFCLTNSIIYSDFRKSLARLPELAIALVAAAVIAVIFLYDLTGYDRYIPKEDSIESVAVAFESLDTEQSIYEVDKGPEGGSLEYTDSTQYILKHMESDKIKEAINLATIGVSELKPYKSVFDRQQGNAAVPIAKTTYSYGHPDNVQKNCYVIKYKLKSGRSVYRSYNASISATYNDTAAFYDSEEYKNVVNGLDNIIKYGNIGVIRINGLNYSEIGKITGTDVEAFLENYRKDVFDRTLDDMKKEYPIANLSSSGDEKNYEGFYLSGYYIYPCDTNTVDFLKSKGIELEDSHPSVSDLAQTINKITVSVYDEANDGSKQVEYLPGSDDDIINKIISCGIVDQYSYVNSVLREYDSQVSIICNYLNLEGYVNDAYLSIPIKDMPKQVYTDLESAEIVQW